MDFEFGQTKESEAFFQRHKDFYPAFEHVVALSNKCFGREYTPRCHLDNICFNLGQSCRDDFLEILFLAANGHGIGSLKLLRGLYERAVVLHYLTDNPNKVERFMNFAAVQENKLITEALQLFSEEDLERR